MNQTIIASCSLCGTPAFVIPDGVGHYICEDATACMTKVIDQELAEFEALKKNVARLDAIRNKKLIRMGQLERTLGKYDAVVLAHQAEMAKLETE